MKNQGLSQPEAAERLRRWGPNRLPPRKKTGNWAIFFDQLKSPLIFILLGAMAITGLWLKDFEDTVVIGAAVVFNSVLGWFQERKANRSLEALAAVLQPMAKVKRDGRWQDIEAGLVVPGDICRLLIGTKVPADGRLVAANSLAVNEAVLTGESGAVDKQSGDPVFMGTVIAAGTGEMTVTATGSATRFGQIAASLTETREPATPLQRQLNRLAKALAVIVLAVSAAIAVTGLVKGIGVEVILPTAVALAVASIPEGLAVALTVILAVGMQRILKRKALVRKLVAAETLGGVTVICCDKTGTLTEGKMRVVKALSDNEPLLRQAAILCNDMRDPLELAMLEWAEKHLTDGKSSISEGKRLDSIPFDHGRKYIVTLHPGIMFVSGAPEVIAAKCGRKLPQEAAAEAGLGRRLVGFAYKQCHGNTVTPNDVAGLTWLGLLIYDDPVRKGVKAALDQARKAGIKIKVVTGDYRATAEAVAKKLGIGPEDVFSRVAPAGKLKIVDKLQAGGEVVAMTGDGVNDAPALKKANIGIVVAQASDVAKETADMVLLDNNFATILAAVAEGRLIRDNLKKVLLYLLADSFGEIIIVVLSLLAGVPLAVTAGMILWINLVSDGFPSLALTVEPAEGNLLARRPDRRQNWLIDAETVWLIGLISLISALTAFAAFWYYWQLPGYGLDHARSVAFSLLGLNSLVYVWPARALTRPFWRVSISKNIYLLLAVLGGLGLQLTGIYSGWGRRFLGTVALGLNEWLLIGAFSLIMLSVVEGVKRRFNHAD